MLFNSIEFLLFLPIVFTLYWLLSKSKIVFQNLLLLIASYVFYGWWDARFLALIILSTVVDYFVGLKIDETDKKNIKQRWLWSSIIFNLGLLGFFKYYNFFIESWVEAFERIGYNLDPWTINIILPVGISFYTFQTMSYSLDIYRGNLKPTKDFISFAAFVSFFPQLVAGPIERASNLLPQILGKRSFSYPQAVQGLRLILWGMFKKVAIADALAPSVNEIFAHYTDYSTTTLLLGAFYFSLQIYCDFSGYSDIAIGTAKLFGIDLMTNFKFPYLSRSIGEFWRRWHISLSTWFRDYLYIPLGGSRVNKIKGIRNVFIIFLVSGLWHGANWTFLVWGGIHALLFVPSFIMESNRRGFSSWKIKKISIHNLQDVLRVLFVFFIVTFAWIFFRAESIHHALDYLNFIIQNNGLENDFLNPYDNQSLLIEHLFIFFLFASELFLLSNYRLYFPKLIRYAAYSLMILVIISAIHENGNHAFIYFQF